MTTEVPLELHHPPGDFDVAETEFLIPDVPAMRLTLEGLAIPRCAEWREANPECRYESDPALRSYRSELDLLVCHAPSHQVPAPYCCSAYCTRCAGLRALDGVEPLVPNEWITR